MITIIKFCFNSVPSAPPISVKITKVSGTVIEVQWEPVDCIHHNGHITGYLVQYEAQESGDTQTHITTGEHAIISNLMSSTTYSIEVAAVNSAGTRKFSSAIMAVTQPSEYSSFAFSPSLFSLIFIIVHM